MYSLFHWPKAGFVRAKKYLASHYDRQPAVRYFKPCINVQQKKQKQKTNKKMGEEKQPKQEVDKVKKGISRGGVAVSLLNQKTMLKFYLKLESPKSTEATI